MTRTIARICAASAVAALSLGLTACGGDSGSEDKPEAPASAPAEEAPETAPEETPEGTQEGVATANLPDLVGMVLQDAQDKAQAAGFYGLEDRDALYDRLQVLDSNWKVCEQDPEPGRYNPENTTVILYSVKLDESCP